MAITFGVVSAQECPSGTRKLDIEGKIYCMGEARKSFTSEQQPRRNQQPSLIVSNHVQPDRGSSRTHTATQSRTSTQTIGLPRPVSTTNVDGLTIEIEQSVVKANAPLSSNDLIEIDNFVREFLTLRGQKTGDIRIVFGFESKGDKPLESPQQRRGEKISTIGSVGETVAIIGYRGRRSYESRRVFTDVRHMGDNMTKNAPKIFLETVQIGVEIYGLTKPLKGTPEFKLQVNGDGESEFLVPGDDLRMIGMDQFHQYHPNLFQPGTQIQINPALTPLPANFDLGPVRPKVLAMLSFMYTVYSRQ